MFQGHKCRLQEDEDRSESIFGFLHPNASILKILWRKINWYTIVPHDSQFVKNHFRSENAILLEQQRQVQQKPWFIIHPFSRLRMFWEVLVTIANMIFFVQLPYVAAFDLILPGKDRNIMDTMLTVMEFIFITDLLMNFITGYKLRKSSHIVLDTDRIVRNYLKTTFICDLLSAIPIRFIIKQFEKREEDTGPRINAIRLIKIIRVIPAHIYIKNILRKLEVSYTAQKVVEIIILYITIIHWLSCMHFLVPRLIHGYYPSNSWVILNNIPYKENFMAYLHSLYRAGAMVFQIAYGQTAPKSIEDMITSSITIFLGFVILTYIFVLFIIWLRVFISPESKYDELMDEVQHYMVSYSLPRKLQKRIVSYYEQIFDESYFKEQAIISTLSVQLQNEIMLHLCSNLIRSAVIFQKMSSREIEDTVKKLTLNVLLPGDVILRAGQKSQYLYLISEGTVAVLTEEGEEICCLYDGNYFGEISIVTDWDKEITTFVAKEISELYLLKKRHLVDIMVNNPEIYNYIEETGMQRADILKQLKLTKQ